MSTGDRELKWEKKNNTWWLSLLAAVMMAVAMSFIFEGALGIAIGISLGIPFLFLGETYSAAIDGETLEYRDGEDPATMPLAEVAAMTQEPASGALLIERTDGATLTIGSAGDNDGVADFVSQAQKFVHHV
ncbi:hypothetical protein [Corynebacterium urinipleomorphum]|uniref:hypothetical protein n=1 Tax=Corynebacterium urinipleomorphum TaxID=1852380 RepID=UPI000B35B991|nr:hypothetical protein [Corynebacterium urinipleomorphum]